MKKSCIVSVTANKACVILTKRLQILGFRYGIHISDNNCRMLKYCVL